MINEDIQFKEVANKDFNIDAQNMTTTVASVTTREIQEIDSPFNDKYMKVDIPDAYRVDAKSFIERPFFVDEVTFPDTAAKYDFLTSVVKFLPGDIARSNASVLNMFKMAAYGRPDLIINVSMAGTITHAGCVLVGVLPPFPAYPGYPGSNNKALINTILSGPHAFLHANEATSVAIPVPWYCNTDLATTDMDQTTGYNTTLDITVNNGNYATLVYMVLNPLSPSTGSTKSLRIIVEACFKNFDLAVPTPRYVTWTAQARRCMRNPNFEDFNEVAQAYNIEDWIEADNEKKKRIYSKLIRYAPYAAGLTSLIGVMLRLGFACLVGEELTPIDHVPDIPMKPQMGVLDGLSDFATGLLDSAASGLKMVTTDAIDAGRRAVREYTGLHNPNIPSVQERIITTNTNFVNNTDCPQFFEKLDPFTKYNRIVKEPIFSTDLDEMAVTNIVTKKQMIGTFKVSIEDGVGTMKWSRPISPFQGGNGDTSAVDGVICSNNIELLHAMSRGWRGGLKLTIQSVMNNKQQCKLKVVKLYNPSVQIATAYPEYRSVVNAPTHLLEFTEGGQEHEVLLPYLCRNDITPCTVNMDAEAMYHGIYYIYVAQPLVISDSSPQAIEFNVFISGETDLTFYGYTTSITHRKNFGVVPQPAPPPIELEGENEILNDDRQSRKHNRDDYVAVTRFKPNIDLYRSADNKDLTLMNMYLDQLKMNIGRDKIKWTREQLNNFEIFKKDNEEKYLMVLNNWKNVVMALGSKTNYKAILENWEYDDNDKCISVVIEELRAAQIIKLKKVMRVVERSVFRPQSAKVKVMNEPQKQTHVTREDGKEEQLRHMTRLMPTLDIRHFIRRMYKSQSYSTSINPVSTVNTAIPLASFLGEAPALQNYTPIETFSRMYYGKSVGFKFRIMLSLVNIDPATTVTDVDYLNLRLYYIPQNINTITTDKLVASALPNVNAFASAFSPSDSIPLPFQIIGKESTSTHVVYEFSVPDTSFYKFMGGPNKFYDNSASLFPALSQGDFGSVLLQFTNLSQNKNAIYTFELFVGLTDESRFGYHTIAPPFVVDKTSATYLGTNTSPGTTASPVLNPYIYRGGFP